MWGGQESSDYSGSDEDDWECNGCPEGLPNQDTHGELQDYQSTYQRLDEDVLGDDSDDGDDNMFLDQAPKKKNHTSRITTSVSMGSEFLLSALTAFADICCGEVP